MSRTILAKSLSFQAGEVNHGVDLIVCYYLTYSLSFLDSVAIDLATQMFD
jgi:hypothetical protein